MSLLSTATATAAADRWINATEASVILETNYQNVRRLAAAGRIKVRRLPGTKAKYLRPSVEALARSCVHAATVEEGL